MCHTVYFYIHRDPRLSFARATVLICIERSYLSCTLTMHQHRGLFIVPFVLQATRARDHNLMRMNLFTDGEPMTAQYKLCAVNRR